MSQLAYNASLPHAGPSYYAALQQSAQGGQNPAEVAAIQAQAQQRAMQQQAEAQAAQQASAQQQQMRMMAAQAAAQQQQMRMQGSQRLTEMGYQGALGEQQDYRREGIRSREAEQGMDLQARLNQIQLGQTEEMRLNRLRQARASVQGNTDLTDQEKKMLMTQIETGLNPLENRMRESQMLGQQIQSQAAHQNMQQQATLFNQNQEHLARGIQGALTTVTDPNTGYSQLFHRDAQGRITPLDFSMQQQRQEMAMQQAQVGMAGDIQGIQQRGQMFPGQMRAQEYQLAHSALSNEALTQSVAHARNMNQEQLQSLQTETAWRRQQIAGDIQAMEIRGERAPIELRSMLRNLEIAEETLRNNRVTNPLREAGMRFDLEQTGPAQVDNTLANTAASRARTQTEEASLYGAPRATFESRVDQNIRREAGNFAAGFGAGPEERDELIQSVTPEQRQAAIQTQLNRAVLSRSGITPQQQGPIINRATTAVDAEARARSAAIGRNQPPPTNGFQRAIDAELTELRRMPGFAEMVRIGAMQETPDFVIERARDRAIRDRIQEATDLRRRGQPSMLDDDGDGPSSSETPTPRPINANDPATPLEREALGVFDLARDQVMSAPNWTLQQRTSMIAKIQEAQALITQWRGRHNMPADAGRRFDALRDEIRMIPESGNQRAPVQPGAGAVPPRALPTPAPYSVESMRRGGNIR